MNDRIPRMGQGLGRLNRDRMSQGLGRINEDGSAKVRPTSPLPGSQAPTMGIGQMNNKFWDNIPNKPYLYDSVTPMPRGGIPQPGEGLGQMNRERVAQGLKRIRPMNPAGGGGGMQMPKPTGPRPQPTPIDPGLAPGPNFNFGGQVRPLIDAMTWSTDKLPQPLPRPIAGGSNQLGDLLAQITAMYGG